MKQIIGFATQYYTLWECHIVPQYALDAYGKYHHTHDNHHYRYIKNVSKSIDTVKSLHPDLQIDEGLRGKTASFWKMGQANLPEEYFWGGKYRGHLIEEILKSDYNYCMWAMDNFPNVRETILESHYYQEIQRELEEKKQEVLQSLSLIKAGQSPTLHFATNGYNLEEDGTCVATAEYEDVKVRVICSDTHRVGGMYPYLMPIINGKAQRTKGKSIKVNVVEVIKTEAYVTKGVPSAFQIIKIS